MGVVIGAGLSMAANPEELPVGRGSIAVAPDSSKGLGVDCIDQFWSTRIPISWNGSAKTAHSSTFADRSDAKLRLRIRIIANKKRLLIFR